MNLEDLKGEIISHLAGESNLRVGEERESHYWDNDDYTNQKIETAWTLYEDPNKAQISDWIEKDTDNAVLGQVVLRETKLYFDPGFKPREEPNHYNQNPCSERMFLADLVAPDSFDIAIKTLRHALNVMNVCKPPKGVGLFGSMTPPGMGPGMPPFPFGK